MAFPETRLRRFRKTPTLRRLVRETRLSPDDLVLPLFVCPGEGVAKPISSMPGVFQHSVDQLVETAREAFAEGIRAVLLFGIPEHKDARAAPPGRRTASSSAPCARSSRRGAGPGQDRRRLLLRVHRPRPLRRARRPTRWTTTRRSPNLARQAVSLAEAGADIVAPSDMMDGRVGAIRTGARRRGLRRDADPRLRGQVRQRLLRPVPRGRRVGARSSATAAPTRWTRRTAARRCARSALDVEEGADMLMVKPALAYLDILAAMRERFDLPLAAYHVSGEYAMLKAAAERGWIDYDRVMMEIAPRHPPRRRRPDHHLRAPARRRWLLAAGATVDMDDLHGTAPRQILPGGVSSPVRAFRGSAARRSSCAPRRAPGSRGRTAGATSTTSAATGPHILGHRHPAIVAAIAEALGRGTAFGAPTLAEVEIAETIVSALPSVEMVRLVNSGTEATMSALRLARAATGRDRFVKFEGCYHGHADPLPDRGRLGRGDDRRPVLPRRARRRGGRHPARPLQRPRRRASGCSTRHRATRSPPSSSSRSPATWAWCRPCPASSKGCATSATATARC